MLRRARALTVAYVLVALSPLWAASWGISFRAATYVEVYLFAAMYFALTMSPEEIYRNLAHAAAAAGRDERHRPVHVSAVGRSCARGGTACSSRRTSLAS